ncbi:MAG: methyltransferase domain-containing protein [Acidobacteria bacterium]|nr:methyltransferase domain-containing protein [Acidobacteriota bacterium]
MSWKEYSPDYIRRRYSRLAAFYPVFELVFWLPPGIRRRAVARLELKPGDLVLEVGCGTGRNFPHLIRAVGADGQVCGVDFTPAMLSVARKQCAQHGWQNVTLLEGDAASLQLPQPVDAVLFSLSYAVMPNHREVLREVWKHLRPGAHLVVLDAKSPRGLLGRVTRPLGTLVSRASVLGNPDRRPWEDLREFTNLIAVEEELMGMYYICRGTKPAEA